MQPRPRPWPRPPPAPLDDGSDVAPPCVRHRGMRRVRGCARGRRWSATATANCADGRAETLFWPRSLRTQQEDCVGLQHARQIPTISRLVCCRGTAVELSAPGRRRCSLRSEAGKWSEQSRRVLACMISNLRSAYNRRACMLVPTSSEQRQLECGLGTVRPHRSRVSRADVHALALGCAAKCCAEYTAKGVPRCGRPAADIGVAAF
eukprot:364182-Chlamydomonas_euryale.AAC.4